MIDIKLEQERLGDALIEKYKQTPVRESNADVRIASALRDISITLAMIYDKLNEG